MMNILLIILSVVCGCAKNLLSKCCRSGSVWKFNTLLFFVAFIFLLICAAPLGTASIFTVFLAVFYAAFTLSGQIFYIKAIRNGSIIISSLIYSFGFVIPTVFGTLFWHEPVFLSRIAGFVLMFVSLIIGTGKSNGYKTRKELGFAVLAMICSGMVGVIQKIFGMSQYKSELNIFLVIAFFIISVSSFVMSLTEKSSVKGSGILWTAILMGLSVGIANKTNLYLSSVLPSLVMFPAVNGGCIILSAIASRIIFAEKLTRSKTLSVILGLCAMVLIII